MRPLGPELEEEVLEIARRLGREGDPMYWKQKYFELLASNVRRKTGREIWLGMLVASASVAAPLLLLRWLHL